MLAIAVIASLLVGLSPASSDEPPTPEAQVLSILEDFLRYCDGGTAESIGNRLRADGWRERRWDASMDAPGSALFYAPDSRPRYFGSGWIELSTDHGRVRCSVTGDLGSTAVTDLLAQHIAAQVGAVATSPKRAWDDCARFSFPDREMHACTVNIQPHGVLSSIETSYFPPSF